MSTNPNDRAFPVYDEAERGLTKREWMAGQVAAGVGPNGQLIKCVDHSHYAQAIVERAARSLAWRSL